MSRARFLPEGAEIVAADETVLWEGRPLVTGLVRHLFHIRAIMGYFAVLAIWTLASAHADGFRANAAFVSVAWLVLPALVAAAVIYGMACVFALTTRYAITDRRVILQIGVALPIALTLPLRKITAADVRLNADGSGDIPLALGDQTLAYLLLWPHARPWRFRRPQPMLRSIGDAREVANILSRALVAAQPDGEAISVAPARRPAPRVEPEVAPA